MPTRRQQASALRAAARERTERAAQAARLATARRAAGWLRGQDPAVLGHLTEVGLLQRDWLEHRGGPVVRDDVEPGLVLTRALEALVERRPSTLASLGLSTVTVLRGALASGPAAGEQEQATIVFTDLEGFTAWTLASGDERAREVLTAHYARAGRVVRSRGGRVVKRLGDGLLLRFPDPVAATLAALELAADPGTPLRLRAGAHTGPVLAHGDDVAGTTVNVAARVTDLAEGGQVLVSDAVAAALEGDPGLHLGPPRRVQLDGIHGGTVVRDVATRG